MSPSRKSPPSAVVGLDIGSDSIKVVEARYSKDGITVTGMGVARTPAGAIENEIVVDPKALGAAIKALLAENGIKTKQCVSSVAGQSRVVVRVIEVPRMTPQELAETMKWEVERYVPFSPSEVVMDFQPLDKPDADPNAQNMEVLLAVAHEELIKGHVEALQAAGLKPMAIDVEPLAASRALVETVRNGTRDEVIAIVNIGANNTDLGVFESGILTFPSPPLSIAGVSFTREIAESLGETLEQAETLKKEYAAVDLNAFAAAPAPDAQPDPGPAASASEPTSFGTSVGPGLDFASAFDVDDEPSPAPADPSDLAAEPAQLNDFQDTVDGPVFDTADPMGVPAFDLGGGGEEQPASVGPAFDLGGDAPESAAGPAFDLGGDEPAAAPAGPTFDLDDGTAADEPLDPSFDLSDTDAHADPGEAAAMQPIGGPPHQSGSVEERVFQAISGVLVDLADELRRSLEYYANRYSRMPERIYLSGGTAKMPNLCEFLTNQLGVPVELADPIKNLNSKITNVSDRYVKEVSPLFSVSVGLAIRDMIG